MSIKTLLLILNFVLLAGLAVYVFTRQSPSGSNAYILNQEVFDKFKGKQELEKKLNEIKTLNKRKTDSLVQLITYTQKPELLQEYRESIHYIELSEQQLTNQYSEDIWKRINQYVIEYGKEHHYDFIFGATGNGSVMYASEARNITDEVVVYINKKYDGD